MISFSKVGSKFKTCFLSQNYRICDVIKLQHNLTANVGVHRYAKPNSIEFYVSWGYTQTHKHSLINITCAAIFQ